MFERIGKAAENLATNVSESRRGFLVRLGQAAVGFAGVVGGLLAFPTGARASNPSHFGYCEHLGVPHGPIARLSGVCVASDCSTKFTPAQCSGFGSSPGTFCGKQIVFGRTCSF